MPDTNQGIKIMEGNKNNDYFWSVNAKDNKLKEMKPNRKTKEDIENNDYSGCVYFDEKWKADVYIDLSKVICTILENYKK